MNVQDVVNRVKRSFGDEAGVQISDADIMRWINDAQLQISIENPGMGETTATTDIVTDQMDYAFPEDLSELRSLTYKGFRLKYMSFQEFSEYVDGFEASSDVSPYGSGIPEVYTRWEENLKLFPKPNEDVTSGLKIFYLRHPPAITSLADELSVPMKYHNSVVNYCLQQAYELDEDFEKSSYKKSQFDADIMKLSNANKDTEEYYPRITTLPEDENYGNYGYWGGYY